MDQSNNFDISTLDYDELIKRISLVSPITLSQKEIIKNKTANSFFCPFCNQKRSKRTALDKHIINMHLFYGYSHTCLHPKCKTTLFNWPNEGHHTTAHQISIASCKCFKMYREKKERLKAILDYINKSQFNANQAYAYAQNCAAIIPNMQSQKIVSKSAQTRFEQKQENIIYRCEHQNCPFTTFVKNDISGHHLSVHSMSIKECLECLNPSCKKPEINQIIDLPPEIITDELIRAFEIR